MTNSIYGKGAKDLRAAKDRWLPYLDESRNGKTTAMMLNGATYKEAAAFAGVTVERARQIIYKTLREVEIKDAKQKVTGLCSAAPQPSRFDPSTPLDDFFPSVRAMNALRNEGIETVEDLRKVNKDSLRRIPGCGPTTVAEILEIRGLIYP